MKRLVTFNTTNTTLPAQLLYEGLKFRSQGSTTLYLNRIGSAQFPDMKISRNNGHNWTTYNSEQIHLNDGETVCFKGNNPNGFNNNNDTYCKFVMSGTGTLTVQGSITSLLDDGKGDLTTMKEVSYHTLLPNLYALINCDNIRAMFVRSLDGWQQIADASQQHDFLHKVKEHRSLSFTEEK